MDKGIVKIVLNDTQITELYQLYDHLLNSFEIDSPHDLLLKGHVQELRDRLRKDMDKCQNKYTVWLKGTEACAFVQTWRGAIKPLPIYSAQIIQMIFNKLDQTAKQPRYAHR